MHRQLVAGLCVLATWSANAEPVALIDEALKQAVSGKTLHLDTPLGVTVPITYHGNGLMSGKAGVLSYILGADNDRGRWWVENGKLCHKWFKWLDAQPNCMRVQQEGQKIFWRRDDGVTGTATIVAGLPEGATAAPRGLGGPPRAMERRETPVSSVAFEANGATTKATSSSAADHRVHHRTFEAVSAVRSLPTTIRTTGLTHPVVQVAHVAKYDLPPDDGWCRESRTGPDESLSAPGLIAVARQSLGAEFFLDVTSCFSSEPALVRATRAGMTP